MVERHRKLNRWEKYDYSMAGLEIAKIAIIASEFFPLSA